MEGILGALVVLIGRLSRIDSLCFAHVYTSGIILLVLFTLEERKLQILVAIRVVLGVGRMHYRIDCVRGFTLHCNTLGIMVLLNALAFQRIVDMVRHRAGRSHRSGTNGTAVMIVAAHTGIGEVSFRGTLEGGGSGRTVSWLDSGAGRGITEAFVWRARIRSNTLSFGAHNSIRAGVALKTNVRCGASDSLGADQSKAGAAQEEGKVALHLKITELEWRLE